MKKVLNNHHYRGELVQSRTETITVTSAKRREVNEDDLIIIEDIHEAIIPKETFKAFQEMMTKRTRAAQPRRSTYSLMFYTVKNVKKEFCLRLIKKAIVAEGT
ncbi:recombinase family protein [Cytobacillus gottheilii]|uniref:recombinase family protein n=1 Tax=Cytobacillus gottheilii TaxID=859144 RepID=UPI0009BB0EB0